MQRGEFVENFSWDDPNFAELKIPPFDTLNEDQRIALLDDEDEFNAAQELTEDDYKEMCMVIPQYVDVSRGQVCAGVETSWPRRCFKKARIEDLHKAEKRYIYKAMERKGIRLYNAYVNEERIAKRQKNSVEDAQEYYQEVKYRRLLFQRIQGLADPAPSFRQTCDSIESEQSMVTVIDTQKSSQHEMNNNRADNNEAFGEDDNDDVELLFPDWDKENDNPSQNQVNNTNTQNNSQHTNGPSNNKRKCIWNDDDSTVDDDPNIIFSNGDKTPMVPSQESNRYNDIYSDSYISRDTPSLQDDQQSVADFPNYTPDMETSDVVDIDALTIHGINNLRKGKQNLVIAPSSQMDQSDIDADTFDFLSPNMEEAITSTQN